MTTSAPSTRDRTDTAVEELLPTRDSGRPGVVPPWIPIAFFVSGFAALVYQVIWQRALFAIVGINIESVTLVVAAFLLGLGLGSLAGGALSKNPRRPLLYFAIAELGIAVFGVLSLHFFRWVGLLTLHLSPLATGFVTFAVLLLPTLLMGMTLPLLVAHAVRVCGNVGLSVGMLYYVNTAGSAIAALAAVTVLMPNLGQQGSVRTAAVLNCAVGMFVLLQYVRARSEA